MTGSVTSIFFIFFSRIFARWRHTYTDLECTAVTLRLQLTPRNDFSVLTRETYIQTQIHPARNGWGYPISEGALRSLRMRVGPDDRPSRKMQKWKWARNVALKWQWATAPCIVVVELDQFWAARLCSLVQASCVSRPSTQQHTAPANVVYRETKQCRWFESTVRPWNLRL